MKKNLQSSLLFFLLLFTCTSKGLTPNFSLVSISAPNLNQNDCYTVTATLHNNGPTGTYDFECDLDNSSGVFQRFIEKKCSQPVSSGANINLTFSTYSTSGQDNSIITNPPGSYKIQIVVLYSNCFQCGGHTCATNYTGTTNIQILSNNCPGYCMSNSTITTCSGTFYDSGGNGNYGNNENYTETFIPSITGDKIQLSFSSFGIENNYDYMYIYDGPNTSYTLIGTYTSTNSPGTVTASNSTGDLTIRFTSDGSNYCYDPYCSCYPTFYGWEASISCVSTCTPVTVSTWPTNQTVTAPSLASFTVYVSGTSPTFQWQYSTDNGNNWSNVSNTGSYSGANTYNLTINPTYTYMNGYLFRCMIGGSCTTTFYTNWVSLTVNSGCSYSYNPTYQQNPFSNIPQSGGYYSISVNTNSGCTWNVNNTCTSWIQNNSNTSFTGSGTYSFYVTPNNSNSPRSCSYLYVNGDTQQPYYIYQNGCTYSFASIHQDIPQEGESNNFVHVNSQSGCQFTPHSNSSWCNIDSYNSNTIFYSITTPNTDINPRYATIYVDNGNNLTVAQQGTIPQIPLNSVPFTNPYTPKTIEPINLVTGTYDYAHTDFTIPIVGGMLNFTRSYSTGNNSYNNTMGYGWTNSYDMNVIRHIISNTLSDTLMVHNGDGHITYFILKADGSNTTFPLFPGVYDSLIISGNNYILTTKNKVIYTFDINNNGQLTSITDRNQNQCTLNYSGNLLSSITGTGGRTLTLTYDNSGRISSIYDVLGRTVYYAYDGNGDLSTVTDANGGITSFAYNSHMITQITDARTNILLINQYTGNQVTLQYDVNYVATNISYSTTLNGYQSIVTDAYGNTKTYNSDSQYRLTQLTDENGGNTYYSYDNMNNLINITDANGNQKSFVYDSNGNLNTINEPLGKITSLLYNFWNDPNSITNALGQLTQISNDANGNPDTITDAKLKNIITYYDNQGQLSSISDSAGTTTFHNNGFGDVDMITTPFGTTYITYDSVGRITNLTDANSHYHNYIYDNNNNLLQDIDQNQDSLCYHYDANNNRTLIKDKKGNSTQYNNDTKNRLHQIIDANGGTTNLQYDNLDRLVTVTDANNHSVYTGYNSKSQIISKTNALGGTTLFSRDAVGNITAIQDPLGNIFNLTYDSLYRCRSISDPYTNTISFVYDLLGNITSKTDALSFTTLYGHDAVSLLDSVTDALHNYTAYSYDACRNLKSYTDPNQHSFSFTYDALNRLITRVVGNGTYTYGWDAGNNLTSLTDPLNITMTNTYDYLNRITHRNYNSTIPVDYYFTFDKNNNDSLVTNGTVTETKTRDALNRVTNINNSFTNTNLSFVYDTVGNTTQIIYPGNNHVVHYYYNANNQIISMTDWDNNTTNWYYNNTERLDSIVYPNGMKTIMTFDNAGRLKNLINSNGNSIVSSNIFTLDANGQRTIDSGIQVLPNYYVGIDTSVNIYDPSDRLTNINGNTVTNNVRGDILNKPPGITTARYGFTGDDLVDSIMIGNQTIINTFGAYGERISKTKNGVTTVYVYDMRGIPKVLMEQNSNGVIAYYIYGATGLCERIDVNDSIRFYHHDAIGNTVSLTNINGQVTDKYSYSDYGVMTNHFGTNPQPFQFMGKYGVVTDTNYIYYVRARYYDASIKRFISRDPYPSEIINPQTLNNFVYGLDNPISYVDYTGLYRNVDNSNSLGGGGVWNNFLNGFDKFRNTIDNIDDGSFLKVYDYYDVGTGLANVHLGLYNNQAKFYSNSFGGNANFTSEEVSLQKGAWEGLSLVRNAFTVVRSTTDFLDENWHGKVKGSTFVNVLGSLGVAAAAITLGPEVAAVIGLGWLMGLKPIDNLADKFLHFF